jgi:hypothetical protein
MNLMEKLILNAISHKVTKWFDLERSLSSLENVCHPAENSPEKSWPDPDKIPNGGEVPFSLKNIFIVGHSLRSSIHEGVKAIKSIRENPKTGKRSMKASELKEFEGHRIHKAAATFDFQRQSGFV